MSGLKSVTGVLRLPELRLNFYLSFEETEPKGEDTEKIGRDDAEKIGKIMNQAFGLSPEMTELLVKFAEFLEKHVEKPSGQGPTT